MSTTICYVAGKSGGHIIPCLTLAQEAKHQQSTTKTVLLCGTSTLETTLLTDTTSMDHVHGMDLRSFPKSWWRLPFFVWQLIATTIKTFKLLWHYRPSRVVTTGGLIAFPACLAARTLGIPIELHELNATPGRAIKLLAPLAHTIFVCFPSAQKFFPPNRCAVASYPLRSLPLITQQQARSHLNLDSNSLTIFIMGGSQGSLFLNQLWKQWLITHQETRHQLIQVIHHVGMYDKDDWQSWYAHHKIKVHLFTFTHHINACYKASDLVICRSGAGTLFELEAYKIPYITIPLPRRITPHQYDNAYAMIQQSSLATILTQEDLESTPQLFNEVLSKKIQFGQPSGF